MCPYVHMSICPCLCPCPWARTWKYEHMDLDTWTYGHLDIWIYGHAAGMQDMTMYIVLKVLNGNVKNLKKKHGEFTSLFRRLFTLDVLSH
jgi:hypothetical protein